MTAPSTRYLSWPPPGLESIHGRLWPLIAFLVIADVVLVLPIMAALGTEQSFTSMGPFGRYWWIMLLTTALGVLIFAGAAERLVRLTWRAGKAANTGYGWRTVLLVASDESRDTGFLLQGARHFSGLEPAQRHAVLTVRHASTILSLAGAMLAPGGLLLGTLLALRGWLSAGALWILAVWLPLALIVGGGIARVAGYLLARSGAVPQDHTSHVEALRGEVSEWTERSRDIVTDAPAVFGAPNRGRPFRVSAVLAGIGAVVVAVAVTFMTVVGSVGPILMSVAVPKFSRTVGRLMEAEVYRPYRPAADPNLSAATAGEALHALLEAGVTDRPEQIRVPVRRYDAFTLDTLLDGPRDSEWIIEMFGRGARGLSAAERGMLRRAAQYPALVEFRTLGAARQADIVSTRYTLPFPEDLLPYALPIPRFRPLRDASRARLMAALLDLAEGRRSQAERGLYDIISTGLLLIDEGPTLLDALIGTVMVREAGHALEALLTGTGRAEEASGLARVREQTRLVTERLRATSIGGNVETALRSMRDIVMDTTIVRGLRWEFYVQVRGFGPCANLHVMVFGPGDGFDAWVNEAHVALVRYEGEEQLFDMMSRGFFGTGGCLPVLGELGW